MSVTSELGPAPADVLLSDGSIAVIRPLLPDDGPALHELHEQVSDEAIRLRFFSVARHAAHAYVDHVLDDPETLALVAERHGRLIGLATAEPMTRPAPRWPSWSPTTPAAWASGPCCSSTWPRWRWPAGSPSSRPTCSPRTTRC